MAFWACSAAGRIAKALRGNRAHGCERIFDAMMQFFQDQLLKLVRSLALLGIDTGLSQQSLRADFGLRQQQPKADIFSRQQLLGRRRIGRQTARRPDHGWFSTSTMGTTICPVAVISFRYDFAGA